MTNDQREILEALGIKLEDLNLMNFDALNLVADAVEEFSVPTLMVRSRRALVAKLRNSANLSVRSGPASNLNPTEKLIMEHWGADRLAELTDFLGWCYEQNICLPIASAAESCKQDPIQLVDPNSRYVEPGLNLQEDGYLSFTTLVSEEDQQMEEEGIINDSVDQEDAEGEEVEFDGLFDLDDIVTRLPLSRTTYRIEWTGELSPSFRSNYIRSVLHGKLPHPYFFIDSTGVTNDSQPADRDLDNWYELGPSHLTISRMGSLDCPRIFQALLQAAEASTSFHRIHTAYSNPTPISGYNSYVTALRREVV